MLILQRCDATQSRHTRSGTAQMAPLGSPTTGLRVAPRVTARRPPSRHARAPEPAAADGATVHRTVIRLELIVTFSDTFCAAIC